MKKTVIFIFLLISVLANANIRMPLIFSDGMVLQRDKQIPIWGFADANESVEIHFNKQVKKTTADKNGKWTVNLSAEKAGGPFELTIIGKNKITIKNVLVGEVWICSGQSNMEFQVFKSMNGEKEIADANYPMIRHFGVAQDLSGTPKDDLKQGKWEEANKKNVGNFTAVGYYFARKLYAELKIPIGIINTSWGGTNVETWTSREAFEKSPDFKAMIADVPTLNVDSISKLYARKMKERVEKIQGNPVSSDNEDSFKELSFNDNSWGELNTPSLWENQPLGDLDGVVWMRKTITLTADDLKNNAVLSLAKIDDEDITYVNGIEIGRNTQYDLKRVYSVPGNVLKEGKNVIAVRIVDNSGGGGIYGEAQDLKLNIGSKSIPLDGKWKFRVIVVKTALSPNSYPSLLYNAMVNPLVPYGIQGVLWYQGEANVWRAAEYKKSFPLMITDWRTKFKQGNFPFYFVQLSTFDEFGGNSEKGSRWAELREAQSETLKVPNTGMAVTTDIGNAKDIHPTNKQDIGLRLAAIAMNNIYGKKQVHSGPTYKSQEIKGNQIVLTFDNIGSGLSTPNNVELKGFEIAGADKVFHSAKAIIKDNKVIVSSDQVQNPVAVHYGWADDDTAINLFNKEKFPASPFRTDNWEMLTANEKYKVSK
ncbi:Glycosyl hydrolases family 2, sugar binding domain [Flavobacterium anhuiense]|uniref:Glycosyl hydrolases family 2, sugar binding domain n=1 Tax=Flavobacterium anhuiense TaxID=459526 RepID=A0AAC9D3K8_9FLAO|nr:sialate O-acetylesterase [Flavobacterium anhuiense]AOC94922.1 Glycosyl hydrolases family 2, sugar binding domain [Flavobacterium anhuiense]